MRPLRLSLLFVLGIATAPAAFAQGPSDSVDFFEKRIRPILADHCYSCHSAAAKKTKGGLSLDTRDGLLKGGGSGPALVAGEPEKSLLIRAVRHVDEELRMPPKQKLADEQIADLVAWVKAGAADPRKTTSPNKSAMTLDEAKEFWSFRAVKDQTPPRVKDASWPKTSIDHFILARLEAAGIAPVPQADRRTLLRRVTFDLTGLPPTPSEMAAFLGDESPQAFANVVDRLLASPRYGERWGRHWLDVVRYADTSGNPSDYPVPQAHLYRDWVIRAFNKDLPYDLFLREQIAGDLIPGGSDDERADRIVATGYLAMSRRFGPDKALDHHLTLEDTIDNLGRAVLGVSVSCARCHDHKFDPFTMSDYYGLYGIFSSTRYAMPGCEFTKKQENFVPLPAGETKLKAHAVKLADIEAEVKALEIEAAEAKKSPDTPDRKARIDAAEKSLAAAKKQRSDMVAQAPVVPTAYAVAEGKAANARMQLRGDPKRLGDEVPRHFPVVLGGQLLPADAGSGRLQLAEWLTDPKNPLVARVMVNRIWQNHFGKGLVATPNDFGRQGRPPTHPELLDFLAARFVESGWSVKSMHKLILLSSTWQLSSADPLPSVPNDPDNDLCWKFTRRRLDAESIRDSLLFVSGDLDEREGGAHPFPPAKSWGFTQHTPFIAVYETRRRSVYLMQQRQRKHPYFALFDGADPSSSTAIRAPSTTPLQALFLMNDPHAHDAATKFAQRIQDGASDDDARLTLAHQIAFGRQPTPEERLECSEFLKSYRERLTAHKTSAAQIEPMTWSALSRAILSANEFVFVD